jgi:hypothetical protein
MGAPPTQGDENPKRDFFRSLFKALPQLAGCGAVPRPPNVNEGHGFSRAISQLVGEGFSP